MRLISGCFLSNVLGLVLLAYMVREAKGEKVPLNRLLLGAVTGCLVMLPIVMLQTALGWVGEAAVIKGHPLIWEIMMFGVRLAFVEELFKFWGTRAVTWRGAYFTSAYQGLLLPGIVSLSFGLLENLLFVALSLQQFQAEYWLIVMLRAFLGAPAHGAYGIIMGMFYGRAKCASRQGDGAARRRYLCLAVLVPGCIHGLYNWLTNSQIVKIGDTSIVTAAVMALDMLVILSAYYALVRSKAGRGG